MDQAKLIVITGSDGAGKSTLIKNLNRILNQENGENYSVVTSVWDSLETGNFEQKQIHAYLSKLSGPARTLFLFHSLLNGLAIAECKNARVIIADGYFYKYAASELAYGGDPELIKNAAFGFRKPNLVVELKISPEAAWARKTETSAYEKGATDGTAQSSAKSSDAREQFIQFQNRFSKKLNDLKTDDGSWQSIEAGPGIEALTATVLKLVKAVIS